MRTSSIPAVQLFTLFISIQLIVDSVQVDSIQFIRCHSNISKFINYEKFSCYKLYRRTIVSLFRSFQFNFNLVNFIVDSVSLMLIQFGSIIVSLNIVQFINYETNSI